MKKINIALLSVAMLGSMSACEDQLNLENPNQQTTDTFGSESTDLEEICIACYHHLRMEGTSSRLGYLYDAVAGDEVNSYSDNDWWRGMDYLNLPVGTDMGDGLYQHWYYAIKAANELIYRTELLKDNLPEEQYKRLMGQGSFVRGLAYWELGSMFQNIPIITDFLQYNTLEGTYAPTKPQAEVFQQSIDDLKLALEYLPKKDEGGEWAGGRATKGAAAAILSRVYMFQHNFQEAYPILKKFIDVEYGTYSLVANYGDNFREGAQYENNAESVWEIQYADFGSQGTDEEWTPVNNSKNPTMAHAVEAPLTPGEFGGWNDLGASPWLYQLFKSQKTTADNILGLDQRLYWTLGSYEDAYNSTEGYENKVWQKKITTHQTTGARQGLTIVKNTGARQGLYKAVIAGLHCGINLRIVRYSDILLRAAECENEINGPTQQAIDWINQVRQRAGVVDLKLSDFDGNKDKLFEQIANVERPTEFGCEHGRQQDLIRWGFYYDEKRLEQIRLHAASYWAKGDPTKCPTLEDADDDPISHWKPGHEYLPIRDLSLNANPNLEPNSANKSESNRDFYNGYTIHPVVDLAE